MKIEYRVGFDLQDFSRVHAWLTATYWSPGISRERVERGFANSACCVGAFADDQQIGVARVVSDMSRFAYVADVYVAEAYRRRGIGKEMVRQLMTNPSLSDVTTWCLLTLDAQDVYRSLGFDVTRNPERFMICYDRAKVTDET